MSTSPVLVLLGRGLRWIGDHLVRTLLLTLVCLLLLKPISWGVTHAAPQDCGQFTSTQGLSQTTTSSTIPPAQAARCFRLAHQHCQAADLVSRYFGTFNRGETTFSTTNILGGCAFTIYTPPSICRGGAGCLIYGALQPWEPDLICQQVKAGATRFFFTNCSDQLERCLLLDKGGIEQFRITETDCLTSTASRMESASSLRFPSKSNPMDQLG